MAVVTARLLLALLSSESQRARYGLRVVLGAVDAGRATEAGMWEGRGLRRALSRGDPIPCVERAPCGLNFERSALVVTVAVEDVLTGAVFWRRVRTLCRTGWGAFVVDFAAGHALDFSVAYLDNESELSVEGMG